MSFSPPRGGWAILAALSLAAQAPLGPAEKALLDTITPSELKGHVSFLASDLLEGRGTPSRGLDLAAEYIASQFRRLGLEPAGNDGYFQNAAFESVTPVTDGLEFRTEFGGHTYTANRVAPVTTAALSIDNAPVIKVNLEDLAAAEALPESEAAGKVMLAVQPTPPVSSGSAERSRLTHEWNRTRAVLLRKKPALFVTLVTGIFGGRDRLQESGTTRTPTLSAIAIDLAEVVSALPNGPIGARISVKIPAPVVKPVLLRNVAARLPGAAAPLKDTWVIVSAHYDHLGMRTGDAEDNIYNGANDNASGTASMLALAEAFVRARQRPKRSLLFIAFTGEELGLLGSRYYGDHPIVPLESTVALLNLEHMGRTDDPAGSREGALTMSGLEYSSLGETLREAAQRTGMKVWDDPAQNDEYFARSDNQALADAGVPAHTIAVAWVLPVYHRVDDQWETMHYDNMARAVRTAALIVSLIANNSRAPHWNPSNANARPYREAYQRLHPASN
jgi:hypothetical protein